MIKILNEKKIINFALKELWIMAAKYEFEFNESIETARNLFQRALRFLPDSRKLWIEVKIIDVKTIGVNHKYVLDTEYFY